MSLSALLFLFFFAVGVLATFKKPFYGLLLYVMLVYINPQSQWWGGPFQPLRLSLTLSILILVLHLVKREEPSPRRGIVSTDVLMVFFLISLLVSTAFGKVLLQKNVDNITFRYFKYVALYFLITRIIKTKHEYDQFIWANIIGCFYIALNAYFGAGYYSKGRLEGFGGNGWQESEGLATYVCVALPFLLEKYYAESRKPFLTKFTILISVAFILRLLIHTQTRAAFLALLIMSILLVFYSRKLGILHKYVVIMVVGVSVFVYVADEGFWSRMASIGKQFDALSSNSDEVLVEKRVDIWKAGLKMMWENPLAGVGPGNYQVLAEERVANMGRQVAAHNIFVLIGSENGVPGLLILLGIIGSCFFLHIRVRKAMSLTLHGQNFGSSSIFLTLSFVGLLVNGFFYNAIYLEVFFWLCALSVALYQISAQERLGQMAHLTHSLDREAIANMEYSAS